jgi:serine/threonine-protein kinase
VALDEELHREVALKQILDSHADDPTSRQRFLLEAEITGGLEHPGIVPVYGLGAQADGRPYYAMRFIRGDSLKEAIAAFHAQRTRPTRAGSTDLELRRLLRRFLDVCNALDYAHSRGVLHRDIKPGNVILGKYGETLVVDWGLAKATGKSEPGAAERTMVPSSSSGSDAPTLPGLALGTPAYMSPEQAAGDLARLGPPSDVYSLGATLYCLLTGRAPFEDGDVGAMLRAVRKGDFAPPRQLDPGLDQALEAVCLKAMALRPADRYATPRGMADDIERWLADEPVTAWREPWTRGLVRSLARHRTGVTAAAAAGLVALVGLGVVATVQTRNRAALEAKNDELRTANTLIAQANAGLNAANTREQERFLLAMDAIKLFHGDVSEDLLLKERQFQVLRTKLLRGAADFYGRLEDLLKDQTDPESRAALGRAYDELGVVMETIGDQAAALAVHRQALAVRRELASEPNAGAETRTGVMRSLGKVAAIQSSTGDPTGARTSFEEMLRLAQAAAEAGAETEDGRAALAMAHHGLGLELAKSGDPAGALAAYAKALEIRQKLADDFPASGDYPYWVAGTLNNIGTVRYDTGDLAGSREALTQAQLIRQKLADAKPADTRFQRNVAMGHNNLGELLAHMGDPAGARQEYAKALAIRQKLATDNPAVTQFQRDLSVSHANLGLLRSQAGDLAGAREAHEAARDIFQRLAEANPTVREFQSKLAECHHRIGRLLYEAGDPAQARVAYSQALAIREKLAAANPQVTQYLSDLMDSHTDLAELLRTERRPAEARAGFDRSVAAGEPLARDNPRNTLCQTRLADSLRGRALARLDLGDVAGAAADTRSALAIYDRLPSRSPEDWFQTACCHAALARLAAEEGSGVPAGAARAEADQAVALLEKAAEMGCRNVFKYRVESALDSLRNREDFTRLLTELAKTAGTSATGN